MVAISRFKNNFESVLIPCSYRGKKPGCRAVYKIVSKQGYTLINASDVIRIRVYFKELVKKTIVSPWKQGVNVGIELLFG
jgi:hypothetical protein